MRSNTISAAFRPAYGSSATCPTTSRRRCCFILARFAQRVRDLHFMLQLEVVERMVAAPSTAAYGRLSVALQARFRMKKLFKVSKGAFRPPPKVESAVVRLEPLSRILELMNSS